jgi:hypothetical protein
MNIYPYTQLATRIALSLSFMMQNPFPHSIQLSSTMLMSLLAVRWLLAIGLLLGYKTRTMAAIAAFLLLLQVSSLLYTAGKPNSQLGLAVIFFTAAIVLFRDIHYYWSMDSLLERQGAEK